MNHRLPPLPYTLDALAPKMNKLTLEYHHGKHHQTYVDNLNRLIKDTPYENQSLEQIIETSEGAIFNNAAQVWNHTFFFDQFSATPKQAPTGFLAESIELSFGSFGSMKEQFSQAAISHFGSGWVWLVVNKKELDIVPTSNAHTPIRESRNPILTCDVWEHAYYLDCKNARAEYVKNFWDLINWSLIERRFEQIILKK